MSSSPALAAFPGQNGKIAFSDCGPTDCGIFVVNPDGSGRTQITHNSSTATHPEGGVARGQDLFPAWSADGRRLAFTREEVHFVKDPCFPGGGEDEWPIVLEQRAGIYTANALGGAVTRVTPVDSPGSGNYSTRPAWSPGGGKIVYGEYQVLDCEFGNESHLRTINSDGTGRQALRPFGDEPAWAPDGDVIIYRVPPYAIGKTDEGGAGGGLLIYDGVNRYAEPEWFPDGLRFAYVQQSGQTGIYIANADGTNRIRVTADGISSSPAVSPDGTKIAFTSDAVIATMNVDGTDRQTLTTSGRYPDWQPVQPGYPRPKNATTVRAPLVPAYIQCASPNRTHGPPLDSDSCSPPQQRSAVLTTGGTPAGAAAQMTGSVRLTVQAGNAATPADEADVAVKVSITDVRCRTTNAACPGGAGADYEGRLLGVLTGLRITDRSNTPPGPVGVPGTGESVLQVPVQCAATASSAAGATCSTSTTVDALLPGAVIEGKRAVWELGQIHVRDAGPNGTGFESPACPPTCGDGDETLFLREGVFVP